MNFCLQAKMFISLPLLFILFNSIAFELFSCTELSPWYRNQEVCSGDADLKLQKMKKAKDIGVVILATLCAIKISFSAY